MSKPRDGLPRTSGMWVVCVYESPDYLLAVHGPYFTREAAASAAGEVKTAPGVYAVYDVPLWDTRDVKPMLFREPSDFVAEAVSSDAEPTS